MMSLRKQVSVVIIRKPFFKISPQLSVSPFSTGVAPLDRWTINVLNRNTFFSSLATRDG